MSWNENRQRRIRKEIAFSPEEWSKAQTLYAQAVTCDAIYRSYTCFSRVLLTRGVVKVTRVEPLTNPEPIARELMKIGVNINQIAHWANENKTITSEQVLQVCDLMSQVRATLEMFYRDALLTRAQTVK